MGEVCKGRDTHLDRIVAIKVPSSALARDPQMRERFEREARTVSQLNRAVPTDILHSPARVVVSPGTLSIVLEELSGLWNGR
jgi:serine/threonine protein kinase